MTLFVIVYSFDYCWCATFCETLTEKTVNYPLRLKNVTAISLPCKI